MKTKNAILIVVGIVELIGLLCFLVILPFRPSALAFRSSPPKIECTEGIDPKIWKEACIVKVDDDTWRWKESSNLLVTFRFNREIQDGDTFRVQLNSPSWKVVGISNLSKKTEEPQTILKTDCEWMAKLYNIKDRKVEVILTCPSSKEEPDERNFEPWHLRGYITNELK